MDKEEGSTPEVDAAAEMMKEVNRQNVYTGTALEKVSAEFARRLERERDLARAEAARLREEQQKINMGLCFTLDGLIINSNNIGSVRHSLLLPIDCAWNAWVRDETAKRENKQPIHPDNLQKAIDAARAK